MGDATVVTVAKVYDTFLSFNFVEICHFITKGERR